MEMSSTSGQAAAIRVCQVLEGGFAMLNRGVATADVQSDAQLHGYDVDVRQAALAGLPYSVAVFESYEEALVRTRAGECDIGWAAYFNTAARTQCASDPFLCRPLDAASANGAVDSWAPYGCCVDFGVSVWPAEIGVLYADAPVSFYSAVFSMISSPFFVNFMSFSFIWVLVVAHLVWLAERRQNAAQFPARYLDGIDDAIWWALVTLTTIGYGDKVPETPIGRVLGIIWMIVGITMCGILTGHMATHFSDAIKMTSKSIQELDLSNMKVCGYSSVFSSWFFPPSLGYEEAVVANSLAECAEKMQGGEVDIVVSERPNLIWYQQNKGWDSEIVPFESVRISDAIAQVPTGVVFPKNSKLREEIDLRLMRLHETPILRDGQARWFATSTYSRDEVVQWGLVGPALGLVVLYLMSMGVQVLYKKNDGVRTFSRTLSGMTDNGGQAVEKLKRKLTVGGAPRPPHLDDRHRESDDGSDGGFATFLHELHGPAPSAPDATNRERHKPQPQDATTNSAKARQGGGEAETWQLSDMTMDTVQDRVRGSGRMDLSPTTRLSERSIPNLP